MFCKKVLEKNLGNFNVKKNTQTGDFSYYYLGKDDNQIILEDWNEKSHDKIRRDFVCEKKNLGMIRRRLGNTATLYLKSINTIGSIWLRLVGNCSEESQVDKQIENRDHRYYIRRIKLGSHVIQKNKDESISYYLVNKKGEFDYVSSWYPGSFGQALEAAKDKKENGIIIMIFKLSKLFDEPVEKLLDIFGRKN